MQKKQIQNETENNPYQQDDPQIPRPDLRFVENTANKTETGQEPNTNTQKRKDLPKTQWQRLLRLLQKQAI